jgi:chorismate mutase
MKVNLDLIPLENWLPGLHRPLIISGPCSAESEEQVLLSAKAIAEGGSVQVLRAGIWKPRTRPDSFEGLGEVALPWLKNAARETGLYCATEVANAAHVEAALKAGIDILWVGARSTVNPFSVQEIADALKGVDIPVLVKNPVNPDLQLWVGGLERINRAGIRKLGAIHRGFSSFEKTPFRNAPMWEMAIELKTLIPELPVICDPSHISGNRELIPLVAQKALDLDMCGLMIESHINPSVALSDAQQQLKPDDLLRLLRELTYRSAQVDNIAMRDQLSVLRAQIDKLDEEIIHMLASRMDISEKIGEYKRDNNVTILQVNRWDEIISKRSQLGQALGLGDDFIKLLLQIIHKESIRRQTGVMNAEKHAQE